MASNFKSAFVYAIVPMCMYSAFVKNIHMYLIYIVFTIYFLFCKTSEYLDIVIAWLQYSAE